MVNYELHDSGKRQEFESGAVRDSAAGKGRFDLISPVGLRRLAVTYEKGCEKYTPRNWEKGMPISRFLDSAARHINCYLAGEASEDHLAQAAWNLFAAMHFEELRPELQDIPSRLPTIPVQYSDSMTFDREAGEAEKLLLAGAEEIAARADELIQTQHDEQKNEKPTLLQALTNLIVK